MMEMADKYAKAYTEVLEIIKYLSEEEYSKIPNEKIEFYKENMDKNYEFTIDPEKDLSEQNISKEAGAVLITIFRDYFANEKQKLILENILKKNEEKYEQEKREKYNPDNMFKNVNQKSAEENEEKNEMQLIEYKKSFFEKFIDFIKKLIHK